MPEPKVYRRQTWAAPAVDEGSQIIFLPIDSIRPNRAQPRNRFDTNTMIRLADSVRRYGILQPLTVRCAVPETQNRSMSDAQSSKLPYELIAGERRLRAAKLAGLTQVPCVVARADDALAAELAVIENLLREDLNMFEQARAFGRLIIRFSLTQEQIARKMSMSQSAVANKLRLLKLDETEQQMILAAGLTERHARAILRLPANEKRAEAIQYIVDRKCNVAATETYVEKCLSSAHVPVESDEVEQPGINGAAMVGYDPDPCGKKKLIIKDLRIFYNSLEHAVEILKKTGMNPTMERLEEEDKVTICISLRNPIAH